ncbi:sensor histidine kinase [Paenibacillus sp. FSL R7-0331]|uniref:sensor histidine kinase n=1 Tax=Paenibacillus sp. FSL R7-0331 TaxID=1536773 RepID=UPI00069431A7|nr:HAMP domain-containing sensor histidine kinase [Paenibacillus sp. FSL R7-0331]
MKLASPKRVAVLFMFLLLTVLVIAGFAVGRSSGQDMVLLNWEQKWAYPGEETAASAAAAPEEEWLKCSADSGRPLPPAGADAVWLRFDIPETEEYTALLIDKVYGTTLKAYRNNGLIYDSRQTVNFNGSKVLIPISDTQGDGPLYLWSTSGDRGFGVGGQIRLGHYDGLMNLYIKQDLVDVILGTSLMFMAVVLLACLFFVKIKMFSGGYWLVVVIFAFGILFITYSPFLALIMGSREHLTESVFDVALFMLLPAFTLYFEQIFGPGRGRHLVRFRNIQLGFSVFCLLFLLLNTLLSYRLDNLYTFLTVNVTGILMIIQLVYLLGLAVVYAYRGNKDAVIFSTGFALFAVISLSELVLYFSSSSPFHLYWWKWGVVGFILSLIVILGRGFTRNYEQALSYSRELEQFNNAAQRSEKMEIISELAASVAHEVRNPLQVTRGFLQILGERSASKEKEYLNMAMQELDRASVIITDFLTFAKPGMEEVDVFEVSGELRHVAGILVPLANLQGGTMELHLQDELFVLGSPAKFKQAFINLIKNSVEALQEDGLIKVSAWKSGQHIIISVEDNGEGMKLSELARLGEPFYSNKTKGTGLGLMVSFRIIEAMNGAIHFYSKKGQGTEVVVKLPADHNK